MRQRRFNAGWTLMELLIVISIIAVLAVMFLLVNWKKNIYRAHDVRRKADLSIIRRAFEEYYTDRGCYPSQSVLDTCRGDALAPYLSFIPCDPATGKPYLYQPDNDANLCLGNRVCAQLKDLSDPDIPAMGCDPVEGCGWGAGWNYCLAAGSTVTAPGFVPGVQTTPTVAPSPTPLYEGQFACWSGTPVNTCKNLGPGGPQAQNCPRGFADSNCLDMCATHPELVCP